MGAKDEKTLQVCLKISLLLKLSKSKLIYMHIHMDILIRKIYCEIRSEQWGNETPCK
jgi:hypothetical protein